MTNQELSSPDLSSMEAQVLLEIHRESYAHARHSEKLRANYFNFYLAAIAAMLGTSTALYQMASPIPGKLLPESAVLVIGISIWGLSILLIMRAERWGAHITHDLVNVRRIQYVLRLRLPILGDIVHEQEPTAGLSFRRLPWSRNKSIETLAGILGASIGGAVVALALGVGIGGGILLAIAGFSFAILQWLAEVTNSEWRHRNCCLKTTIRGRGLIAILYLLKDLVRDVLRLDFFKS